MIAYIDTLSGRVIYIDHDAATDEFAQRDIQKTVEHYKNRHPYNTAKLEYLCKSIVEHSTDSLDIKDAKERLHSLGFDDGILNFFGFPGHTNLRYEGFIPQDEKMYYFTPESYLVFDLIYYDGQNYLFECSNDVYCYNKDGSIKKLTQEQIKAIKSNKPQVPVDYEINFDIVLSPRLHDWEFLGDKHYYNIFRAETHIPGKYRYYVEDGGNISELELIDAVLTDDFLKKDLKNDCDWDYKGETTDSSYYVSFKLI